MDKNRKSFYARAPGKIILCGEHAVIYNQTAIAMAIDRFVQSKISLQIPQKISFHFENLKVRSSLTWKALQLLHRRLISDYQLFLSGQLPIREVLKKPKELLQFSLAHFIEQLQLPLPNCGLKIETSSSLPTGCGLGSSAASLVSVCRALIEHFHLPFVPEKLYSFLLETEQLQHGRSSGVDLHLSLHGGCCHFSPGGKKNLPFPPLPLCFIHTGNPLSTTGEAVYQVKKKFSHSSIWKEFAEITKNMERSLTHRCHTSFCESVRYVQQLLQTIGVVPERVREFIAEVEQLGGVAKICGSGAVRGQNGGAVLVSAPPGLSALCKKYGYQLLSIQGEMDGVQMV